MHTKPINVLLGKITLNIFLMTERKQLGWDASNFSYELVVLKTFAAKWN
jgi:hypothetical protein